MELIDIVDENNKLTGQVADRWGACTSGLWRRIVSCWIMNEKGEILLQKRSPSKKSNPNLWAKTSGQVDRGETAENAIVREVKEELGVKIPEEQIKVMDIYKSNSSSKSFIYNFLFIVNYEIDDYILQKDEVAEVKYVEIEDIEIAQKNNDLNYIFSNWEEADFNKQMQILKNKRSEILKGKNF